MRSRIRKFHDYRWEGVEPAHYRPSDARFSAITRQTLIDANTRLPDGGIVTRYFELEPGAHTALERHEHAHSVVVLRGRGSVFLGDRFEELDAYDCVETAAGEAHQFLADRGETFGFVCIVERIRDRGRPLSQAELDALELPTRVRRRLRG